MKRRITKDTSLLALSTWHVQATSTNQSIKSGKRNKHDSCAEVVCQGNLVRNVIAALTLKRIVKEIEPSMYVLGRDYLRSGPSIRGPGYKTSTEQAKKQKVEIQNQSTPV